MKNDYITVTEYKTKVFPLIILLQSKLAYDNKVSPNSRRQKDYITFKVLKEFLKSSLPKAPRLQVLSLDSGAVKILLFFEINFGREITDYVLTRLL